MAGEYDLSPNKETYRSLKADVSPISAVKELIDNVLDNWRRNEQENQSITIDIDLDLENDYFRIEDNSGGIREENIAKVFALGESSIGSVSQPIGAYGMGAKKAIVRLGQRATIKSRTNGVDKGYGFTVGEKWLDQPQNWTVPSEEFLDITEGKTIIEIENLQLDFEQNGSENSASQYNDLEEFLGLLSTELGETYEEFLVGAVGSEDGDVSIIVNGSTVTSPSQPDWSYTPYDNFHPRKFTNVKLDVPTRDEPVYLDLKAGLLASGGQENAGTDIYIQNRKIISRSTGEDGGWGTDYLGNYQPALGRARFQVKIYTDGHTDTLPWDTQKSDIDPYDPIMREVFGFLTRAGEHFAKARYGVFPVPFTGSYPESSSYSVDISEYDYSDRVNVRHSKGHTPNEDYPQASEVIDAVELHLEEYGIKAPHLVAEDLQLGYVGRHEQQGDGTSWEVPQDAHEFTESVLYRWLEEIDKQARADANASKRIQFDGLSVWWQPYYEQRISVHSEGDDHEYVDSVPDIESKVESRKSSESLPESVLDVAAREPPEDVETSDSPTEESADESESKNQNKGDGCTGGTNKEDTQDTDDNTEDAESSGGKQEGQANTSESGEGDEKTEKADETEDGISTSGSDGPSSTRKSDPDEELIVISASSETYDMLCEELNLPKDAGPDKVGDALLRQLVKILDEDTSKQLSNEDN